MGLLSRAARPHPDRQLHEAFLERAAAPEGGGGSHALGAFLTMRLVDQFADGGAREGDDALHYQVRSTQDFLLNLHPQSTEVVQLAEIARIAGAALEAGNPRLLWPPMLAFAYRLEQDLRMDEALDVLETGLSVSDGRDAEEEVAALYQRGRVLRKLSRYEAATASYDAAGAAAQRLGDRHTAFLSRIGRGIVLQKVGNLPESERVLGEVISEAVAAGDQDAEARARHDLANCLMLMERPRDAVGMAFAAFELYEPPQQRLRALSDLGMAFKMLGNYTAAEDAFFIVLDGPGQITEIRVNAMLELLHVASLTQNRISFARWRKELSALEPQMAPDARIDFDLKLGIGFAAFSDAARARRFLEAAVARAEEHHVNTYLFQAEAALAELENESVPRAAPEPAALAAPRCDETLQIADRLHALRIGAD